MTAKLVDEKRRRDFQVMVLPNLYGDILTDEAAEFQGGVGTAGSANIGKQYAMFEAIHGSAPRMVTEGRAQYADPCSMIRAAAMLLGHIGYPEKGKNAGNGPRHLRPVREEDDHHRPGERSDRSSLYRLPHGLDQEPEAQFDLGRLRQGLIRVRPGSRRYI